MAKNKTSFLLYNDQISTFEMLSNEEAGILIKHIYNYVNDKNPVLEDRLLQVSFAQIKATLKRDLVKFEGKKEKNVESGNYSALKRYNKDLYLKVKADEMKLEEALKIAETRKETETLSKPVLKTSKTLKPIKDNSVRKLDFDWVWDVYDLKKEKKKALDVWLKLSDKDIKKVKDTIVQYVSINKGQYQKYLYKYLKDENFNEEIQEVKKEISSNGYTTVKKVVDLFNETEFPATIKELKTSKDNLRVRLHEFLERESLEAKFKNRDLKEVLIHFVRAVQYMKPKQVNNVDPYKKAPWVEDPTNTKNKK